MSKQKVWTPSNILTLVRMGGAPLVLVFGYMELALNGNLAFYQVEQAPYPYLGAVAGFCFLLAALTDLLDGYLARKRNEVTTLGKFLDPLADKILVTTALIMLVRLTWIPAWVAILIILREITITAMRSMASAEGIIIAAGHLGKKKTFFQSWAIWFLLIHYSHFGIPFHYVGMVVLYIALFLTLYSGYDYMMKYFSGVRQEAYMTKND